MPEDEDDAVVNHIINLMCAAHLRQEHGFKGWTIPKFRQRYPALIQEDGTFYFVALHVLQHLDVVSVPLLDDSPSMGTFVPSMVAFVTLEPSNHLHH